MSTFDATQTPSSTDGAHGARRVNAVVAVAVACLAVFIVVAAVCLALAGHDRAVAAHQQQGAAAQELDARAQDGDAGVNADPTVRTTASIEIPPLAELLGLTCDDAVDTLGRGAAVRTREADPAGTWSQLVTVALAEERAKDGPAAPTVRLWLDDSGAVAAAGYSASLRSMGFSNALTFRQAIEDADVVQAALADAGVAVKAGSVRLPDDPAAYSTYRDDQFTLEREHADFEGEGTAAAGGPIAWSASLDYDYAEAIQTGNLVYTHRVLCVTAGPLL
ncbi:MAG: hypothetical protein E7000_07300 [Coriobacteriaceae bacterium]|nr:hypothetical protein [Coriobacteriaceae bacterium]